MSRLLIHESPLQVLPSLAVRIGLNEAIILQQVHYWLNPDHNKHFVNGRYWVFNSYEGWVQQFPFWSKDTIKRAISALEKKHLLLSERFNEDKFDHRKWYSINYEELQAFEVCPDRSVQNAPIDRGTSSLIDEGKMHRSVSAVCPEHYKEQRLQQKISLSSPPTPQSGDEVSSGGEEMRELNHGFVEEISECSSSKTPEMSHRESPLSSEGKRVFPQRNRSVTAGEGESHQPLTVSKEERIETREDQMVRIWNTLVQKDLAGRDTQTRPSVCLTSERTHALRKIHQDLCDGDVSLWEMACHTIAASKFLMGEVPGTRFKISFDWFLKPANFLKVLEGGFTSGDRGQDKNSPDNDSLKARAVLTRFASDAALQGLLQEMIGILGTRAFVNWFSKASFSLDEGVLKIQAPTRFMRDWIATHYLGNLQAHLKGVSSMDLCVGETTQ